MDGLECCHCGIEVLEPDAGGQYWEGTCALWMPIPPPPEEL